MTTIEERAKAHCTTPEEYELYCLACDEQQEIDNHQWIPVEERLPEECVDVLLLDEPSNYYDIGHICDDEWSCDDYTFHIDYFTHWMPLPTPPSK